MIGNLKFGSLDEIQGRTKKFKKLWTILLIAFTIHGTCGFILFVSEEAMQTAMFGAFSYSTAEDWEGLAVHLKVMKKVHTSAEWSIHTFGWGAPLMYPAYRNYLRSNEAYIRSVSSRLGYLN